MACWCLLCALLPAVAQAQVFVIADGGASTCSGAFLDSGGQGGSGYSNNEDFTYTLCPDNPGDAISVDFITFQLSTAGAAPIDHLTIYDGNTTGAPLIGSYTGTSLQGQIISAGAGNPSGCLTFVWHSNGTGLGVFAGSITCYVPCTRPVAAATMSPSAPAMICPGEQVSFNGSGSTAAPGNAVVNYTWNWADGSSNSSASPTASHTFNSPGEYVVQLSVTDNNGCVSANLLNLQVLVGTPPTFTGTVAEPGSCVGTPVCLDGQVNATTWSAQPTANFGAGVFLPDDVGSCFTSDLLFSGFAPGATLTNINQLQSICIDIEHSFLGDLVISIISPSGETVVMHQQGGTGTYLGVPVDPDEANPTPGTCWTYCFSPTATNGTMAANAAATLPAGTYESLNPLSGLLGSQLNGNWTIEICDLWGLDNGFLCGWEMDFDPSLFPSLTQFTPVYGNACDSTWWTGPNIVSSSADCEQICVQPPAPGTYDYVYHAVDNFGCTYDTTLSVTISAPPVANAGPDVVMCAGQGPVQLAASATGGAPVQDCTYTLQLLDSFGDGWNGASVTVTINGVPTTYTLNTGSNGSVNLPVQTGDAISISFSPGTYDGEITYRLRNGSNTIVFQDGPFPAIGQAWSGVVNCGTVPITYTYSWSPSTGLSNPNIANPTANPGSTTTYTVTVTQVGQPGCTDTDQVTVTVTTPNGAGTDGSVTLCANDPPIDLFSSLGGATPGGTWTAPGGTATTSTFTPGSSAPGVYTYTVNSAAPCPGIDQSTVTVTVIGPPAPGSNGSVTLCTTSAAVSLAAQLGGAPQPGGTWSGPSPVVGGQFNPATMSAGVYTYTVAGTAPCPPASATVTVNLVPPPSAGTNGSMTICGDAAATSLFALLGGAPQSGGSWSGPSPVPGGMFDPATMSAGIYTYTVTGTAPCPDATATVTVNVVPPPDAGTDGSLAVCSTAPPSSLFAQLGGTPDAGGSWSGPSPVAGGMFDPATMSAGVYTYTVAGTSPCASASATVTVNLSSLPNAGTPGSTTLCTSSAPAALFGLLGGAPQPGGTWSGPSPVIGGQFDPVTMAPGTYTYTVGGNPPCPSASSTVTIAVEQPPVPGTPGAITLCSTDAATDLFTLLGGAPDAGGAWSGPSVLSGSSFDPASMNAGVYSYTVTGTTPCPDASSTVTVTVNTPPDAGNDGTITLCSTNAPVDLFAQLGGAPDAGGTWSGPSALSGSSFDPATMSPGVYTYTVNGAAPCPTASATITVTVNAPVDAGTPGAITLCSTDAATDLFALLGGAPDANGAWSGPSVLSGSSFDPATMGAGVYSYTVAGTTPCPDASSTVTVTVNTPPDAGNDGTITLCATNAPADLFAQLGGAPDAGGTWSGPSALSGSSFDPATMSPGVYTYTVAGTAPCPSASATVTVNVNAPVDAGTPGAITLCSTDAATDIFALLGGAPDAGGAWSGPSVLSGSSFDPATMGAGVYTYTVAGTTPCPDASSTVTVTVNTPPDAGNDGTITLCATNAPADLFAQLGGVPDAGGTWSGPSALSGSSFDPATMSPGVYTYTVNGIAPCPSASAAVTVNVNAPVDAGTPGAITLCSTDAATDLFALLGGTPDAGGAWSGPSVLSGSSFDPASMNAGVYSYTVAGTTPCPDASSTVTVTVNTPPDAGIDGGLTLCATSPAVGLITGLNGTPDAGGTWTGPGGNTVGALFTPGVDAPGTYTYTVLGTTPCPNATAVVNVLVATDPDPGTPGNVTMCTSDAPVLLFSVLGGSPDAGGSWSGPSAIVGGQLDPATMSAGVYTYTITVPPPCTSASSTVTVTLNTPPDPGSDGALTLCATSPATALIGGLGGSPDAGGTWSGPSAVVGGLFAPASMNAGVYTYTVNGTAPCPAASASVTVSVVTNPDPGTPGAITLCTSDAATDLFAQLGGTPDAGGAWSGPSVL
ncbi:MAG: PKD domain-containing protein, partial [Flavobacteriales bacterium]|nr:PKD domain-containing protein [Flavobacteriales bacterium]